MIYIFDASLSGLLTAIFEWFERKSDRVSLIEQRLYQPSAFDENLYIITDQDKANRVWEGLKQKINKQWLRKFYCSYLSETPEAYQHLFDFAIYIFQNKKGAESNYGNTNIIALSKFTKSVEREKHRMEAFIRFQKASDGTFFATIEPDFNVLPLISNHFKNRYADQQWIIYDTKRKYGLHYDLSTVEEITIDFSEQTSVQKPSEIIMDEKEAMFAELWKGYFKSANIEARKNTKLHVRHVPKRYWKYLTEKQL